MKRSGFTLIEVMGVIIIIGLIAILAFPPILQQVANSKNQISDTILQTIYTSVRNHLDQKEATYHKFGGNIFCFPLQELIDNGIVDASIAKVDAVENLSSTKTIKVNVISSVTLDYEIVDSTNCSTINHYPTESADITGASSPVLSGGMIPIKWNGTTWIKADKNNATGALKWYDYGLQEWANVVLVTESRRDFYKNAALGTAVTEADILAYLVWIPRYRYQLFNVESASVPVQEIKIEFEGKTRSKSSGNNNSQWLTHPAFTFGNEELDGIWVGKFETSTDVSLLCYTAASTANCNNETQKPRIKPGLMSLRYQSALTQFTTAKKLNDYKEYGLGTVNDAHMMKNTEWGAIAYLSQSKYGKYGNSIYTGATGLEKEVWNNPSVTFTTGCAGNSLNLTNITYCNEYQTPHGVKASTTGNIYGIYDMSGGTWEVVMGAMYNSGNTTLGTHNSEFTTEQLNNTSLNKYINKYTYGTTLQDIAAYNRRLLGDATGEVWGWNGDYRSFIVSTEGYWFQRGARNQQTTQTGIFGFDRTPGGASGVATFRIVVLGG